MKPFRRDTYFVVLGCLLAAVAACGGTSTAPRPPSSLPPQSITEVVSTAPSVSSADALQLYSGDTNIATFSSQPIRDYLPVSRISLAVVGTVAGYAEGPSFAEYQGDPGGRTTVMAVKVSSVLKGVLSRSNVVYVQLRGAVEPARAAAAVPVGAAVALLLSSPRMHPTNDPGAGRPEGEPLWIPGAQGLIVSNGPGGGVTYPRVDAVDDKVRLDELVADGMKANGQRVTMLEQ